MDYNGVLSECTIYNPGEDKQRRNHAVFIVKKNTEIIVIGYNAISDQII